MATTMKAVGSLSMDTNYFYFPKPSNSLPNPTSNYMNASPFYPNLVKTRSYMIPKYDSTDKEALIVYNKPVNEGVVEKPLDLKVTAEVIIRNTEYMEMMLDRCSDTDPSQSGVVLQLVSSSIDPRTMKARVSNEARLLWSKNIKTEDKQATAYKVEFMVDSRFGVAGAILVGNNYPKEFYLENIVVEGVLRFACSWIQPQNNQPHPRIFFIDKVYLPSETPLGLKELREKELEELRGDGKGTRKIGERVYDYDLYNDLGSPDKGSEYARPTLGGKNRPYPRRCRTGRHSNTTDVNRESPVKEEMTTYVPRDEVLAESKTKAVAEGKLKGLIKNLIPGVRNAFSYNLSIKEFSDINLLYKKRAVSATTENPLPSFVTNIGNSFNEFCKFDPPKGIYSAGEATCSLRDDEFGRLTLRGLNPLSIERLKVFPPMSKLNPSIHGVQESALKEEHIIGHLDGLTVQQAIDENKLYILDYHDLNLPFLNRINALSEKESPRYSHPIFLDSIGNSETDCYRAQPSQY